MELNATPPEAIQDRHIYHPLPFPCSQDPSSPTKDQSHSSELKPSAKILVASSRSSSPILPHKLFHGESLGTELVEDSFPQHKVDAAGFGLTNTLLDTSPSNLALADTISASMSPRDHVSGRSTSALANLLAKKARSRESNPDGPSAQAPTVNPSYLTNDKVDAPSAALGIRSTQAATSLPSARPAVDSSAVPVASNSPKGLFARRFAISESSSPSEKHIFVPKSQINAEESIKKSGSLKRPAKPYVTAVTDDEDNQSENGKPEDVEKPAKRPRRRPVKANRKTKAVVSKKPRAAEVPTRKQPTRRSVNAAYIDVDSEEDTKAEVVESISDHKRKGIKPTLEIGENPSPEPYSRFEDSVVNFGSDGNRKSRVGASQQDPVVLSEGGYTSQSESERQTSRSNIKTLEDDKAPKIPCVSSPLSSHSSRSISKPALKLSQGLKKPALIEFGPGGPRNQGTRPDQKAPVEGKKDGGGVAKASSRASIAKPKKATQQVPGPFGRSSARKPHPKSNTADTVEEALAAFTRSIVRGALTSLHPSKDEVSRSRLEDSPVAKGFDHESNISPIAHSVLTSPQIVPHVLEAHMLMQDEDVQPVDDFEAGSVAEASTFVQQNIFRSQLDFNPKRRAGELQLDNTAAVKRSKISHELQHSKSTLVDFQQPLKNGPSGRFAVEFAPQNVANSLLLSSTEKAARRRSQTVDAHGSPVPAGVLLANNATVLETFSHQLQDQSPELDDLAADTTLIKRKHHYQLPKADRLNVPKSPGRVSSTNRKTLPASPLNDSQVIPQISVCHTNRAGFVLQEDGTGLPTDPFTAPEHITASSQAGILNLMANYTQRMEDCIKMIEAQGQSVRQPIDSPREHQIQPRKSPSLQRSPQISDTTEAILQALISVNERLTVLEYLSKPYSGPNSVCKVALEKHNVLSPQREEISKEMSRNRDDEETDPEITLVESTHRNFTRIREHKPTRRAPLSEKTYNSDTDTQEELDISTWRLNLKPHQVNFFDEIVNISHRLVQDHIDEETANEYMIRDFYRGAVNLIEEDQQERIAAFKEDKDFVEGEKARLKSYLDRWMASTSVLDGKVTGALKLLRADLGIGDFDGDAHEQLFRDYLDEE